MILNWNGRLKLKKKNILTASIISHHAVMSACEQMEIVHTEGVCSPVCHLRVDMKMRA